MTFARMAQPENRHEWVNETKLDGFRRLAYVQNGRCELVSRNGKVYRSRRMVETAATIAREIGARRWRSHRTRPRSLEPIGAS